MATDEPGVTSTGAFLSSNAIRHCLLLAGTLAIGACRSTGPQLLPSVTAASASSDSVPTPAPSIEIEPLVTPVTDGLVTGDTVDTHIWESEPTLVLHSVVGEATYYADMFEGRLTASGTRFRQADMVAAHRGFPFGTVVRVTNLRNDRAVTVTVTDRGPFGAIAERRNTIIDVSRRAARELRFIAAGRTPVRVDVLLWGGGR